LRFTEGYGELIPNLWHPFKKSLNVILLLFSEVNENKNTLKNVISDGNDMNFEGDLSY